MIRVCTEMRMVSIDPCFELETLIASDEYDSVC